MARAEQRREKTILVVEDTPLLRDLTALYLSRLGEVQKTASAAEALDLVFEAPPDLIVSDLKMPEMDGIELCRELKAHPESRRIPFLMFSGSTDSRDRDRALRAGVADYLVKPIERPELLSAAHRLLHQPMPRGLPRIDLETWATLRLGEIEWTGRVRNLSRGGMFVESARALEPDSEVLVQLELPETEASLFSTAQVRWVRRELNETLGMGMRFLALDRDTAKSLARYVEERTPSHAHGPAPVT